MRIIKPSAELIVNDGKSLEFIEKIGRICYKSTDRITEGSAKTFVQGLIKRQHYAMLEHEIIYIKIKTYIMYDYFIKFVNEKSETSTGNSYINVGNYNKIGNTSYIISGNVRAFIELISSRVNSYRGCSHDVSDLSDILCLKIIKQYPDFFNKEAIDLVERNITKINDFGGCFEIMSRKDFIDQAPDDTLYQHLAHTLFFVCDRGITHELVRHRAASFAQESTRYCNYSKNKYDNEITVIEPYFFVDDTHLYSTWEQSCIEAERAYMNLIKNGASAQQARSVLPHSLKVEIVMTATEREWQHILNLRYHGKTGAPHPQMHEVMALAYPILKSESNNRLM